ncbi:MAG: hypothetical protein JO151_04490 [Verrucomicrobia bacterium]|nr:hypothetical protein [Verrucomicrobiota bacterium]
MKAIFSARACNGELHIADYGLQRTPLMRSLFRIVQYIDGFEDTQPNADGILPTLMKGELRAPMNDFPATRSLHSF